MQLVELLLIKVPDEYRAAFRREGVFHEIETLATRSLLASKSKDKEKEKDKQDKESSSDSAPGENPSSSTATTISSLPTSVPIPISAALAASMPGLKKLSSMSLDPEDAVTLRARVIKFKYLSGKDSKDGDDVFSVLRKLVDRLGEGSKDKDNDVVMGATSREKEVMGALKELAALFASANSAVSSFELLQSGVIDALLQFATDKERSRECISCCLHMAYGANSVVFDMRSVGREEAGDAHGGVCTEEIQGIIGISVTACVVREEIAGEFD